MNGMSKAVGVVFLLLIFFSGIFAPAFAISDEIENITINSSENACNTCCGGLEDTNVTVVELTGKEKNKAIAEALKYINVQKLQRELAKMGFKPSIKEISALRVIAPTEDGTLVTNLIIYIPFKKGKNKDESATVVFVRNKFGKTAVASILSNNRIEILNINPTTGNVVTIMSLQCDVCRWLVDKICVSVGTRYGCIPFCAAICLRVPNPIWIAICSAICLYTCKKVFDYGCDIGSDTICRYIGFC